MLCLCKFVTGQLVELSPPDPKDRRQEAAKNLSFVVFTVCRCLLKSATIPQYSEQYYRYGNEVNAPHNDHFDHQLTETNEEDSVSDVLSSVTSLCNTIEQ